MIFNTIQSHGQFHVNDDVLDGDPAPGEPKGLLFSYRLEDRGPLIWRRARQHQDIGFAAQITSLKYGPPGEETMIEDYDVHCNLYDAWMADKARGMMHWFAEDVGFPVNNDTMGGDPAPGHRKQCLVTVHDFTDKRDSTGERWSQTADEGNVMRIQDGCVERRLARDDSERTARQEEAARGEAYKEFSP